MVENSGTHPQPNGRPDAHTGPGTAAGNGQEAREWPPPAESWPPPADDSDEPPAAAWPPPAPEAQPASSPDPGDHQPTSWAPFQAGDSPSGEWPAATHHNGAEVSPDDWPSMPEPPSIDPFSGPPAPTHQSDNGHQDGQWPDHSQPTHQQWADQPQAHERQWAEQPQAQEQQWVEQQPAPPPQQAPPPQHWAEQPVPQPEPDRHYPSPEYRQAEWQPSADMLGREQTPTADDFAQRRAMPPPDPVANQGVRRAMRVGTFGLVKLGPGRKEQDQRHAVDMIRRNFGGLRQVTVINPKGGAGKTVAALMVAMTFGQKRGGYVLAWDNNETQGTLGMRAQQDFHSRTVRDLLRDLAHFRGPTGRVGDLSQYVRAQGEAMFDVLASDESATAGEMLTAEAFADIREVVSRFYKLIVVDTGNNVRAANWQAAIDATDQLVICMSARNDSAETAARALDHLEQTGRHDLVRRAVSVVSMPAHRKDLDLPAVQRHFSARTRAVLLAPYERLLDSGEPIRYSQLTQASRDAWLKIAAAVAEGL